MPNKAEGNPDEGNPSGDYLVWEYDDIDLKIIFTHTQAGWVVKTWSIDSRALEESGEGGASPETHKAHKAPYPSRDGAQVLSTNAEQKRTRMPMERA